MNIDKSVFMQPIQELYQQFDNLQKEIVLFKPSQNSWNIIEHLVHIFDTEINCYICLKNILCDSGNDAFNLNEDKWTRNCNNENYNIEILLSGIKLIRELEYNLIMDNINAFQNKFVIHKKYGKITFEKWLEWYTEYHLNMHLDYIKRNKNEYSNRK